MSDLQNAVDSANADKAAVDSAADTTAERTFTKKEVDALIDAEVKKRIDKQNARHQTAIDEFMAKLTKAEESATAATAERDMLLREKEIEGIKRSVSDEFKVPAAILRGETEEEIRAHAEACKAAFPAYGRYQDSGEHHGPKPSNSELFGNFIRENF